MSSPSNKPPASAAGAAKPPPYISSSGHMLGSQPLTARINRTVDDVYNFLGLYFVSLFSLDPYGAAQNSTFNTRSRGPNHYQNQSRWAQPGGARTQGSGPGAGAGSGGGGGLTGRGGGSGGSGGSGTGPGRRMGTVDDVRGPECGSCG